MRRLVLVGLLVKAELDTHLVIVGLLMGALQRKNMSKDFFLITETLQGLLKERRLKLGPGILQNAGFLTPEQNLLCVISDLFPPASLLLRLRKPSFQEIYPFPAGVLVLVATIVNSSFFFPVDLESKLRVNTEDRSLEISGGADTEIECRVTSLTQGDSQLAITWYFLPPSPADAPPLQIVRANYSNILDYGSEFSSAIQKSKFHSERVSSNLFWLRIQSVNHGDRGRYYCLVEEWLWSPDRGWYKLGKKESGKTMLEFKVSGNYAVLEGILYHSMDVRKKQRLDLQLH